jgi:glycosyltransferase involved in cell wall biosynthesis
VRREVVVTPFGVDLERFVPAPQGAALPVASAAARRSATPLTIGIVKTLAPKYGVDLLLRAMAGLLRDDELRMTPLNLKLLIVGDGPQRNALEALAVQLGIGERTEFVGGVRHRDVPHWLQRMDIFAAPSRSDSESFGVAVVEASACALPVVVANVGGLPEVVQDGRTGLVVPPDDVGALQAALKRLVLDAGLRATLGRQGRARVERDYGWTHCVDLMQACYADTLRGAAPA